MKIVFSKYAWEDYLSWQRDDKKILKKINELIKVIQRTLYEGIGKPEPLKFDLAGYWSRRIDLEHRLVYRYRNGELYIVSCRFHYE
jgi:toxin YoeB